MGANVILTNIDYSSNSSNSFDSLNSLLAPRKMAAVATLSPHDVPTTLNYYAPLENNTEAPYNYVNEPPVGTLRSNVGLDTQPVVVHDARGRESEFHIDKNGFQYVKYPSVEKEFDNDARIEDVYYKEVEDLLKKEVGAKRVFIFDHTIRYVCRMFIMHVNRLVTMPQAQGAGRPTDQ